MTNDPAYKAPKHLRPPGIVPVVLKQRDEVHPTYLCDWDVSTPLGELTKMLTAHRVRHPGEGDTRHDLNGTTPADVVIVAHPSQPAYIEVTYQ